MWLHRACDVRGSEYGLEEIDPFCRHLPEVLLARLAIHHGLKKWELPGGSREQTGRIGFRLTVVTR